jgi:hypothetical protein
MRADCNGPELVEGAVVLHQHRDQLGNTVVNAYTVVAIREGSAVLARGGGRRRRQVPLDTILSSPAWAVQAVLW